MVLIWRLILLVILLVCMPIVINPITSTSILLKSAFMSPSVLTADFNETLQPGERRSGYLNRRGFSRFQSFLDISN